MGFLLLDLQHYLGPYVVRFPAHFLSRSSGHWQRGDTTLFIAVFDLLPSQQDG